MPKKPLLNIQRLESHIKKKIRGLSLFDASPRGRIIITKSILPQQLFYKKLDKTQRQKFREILFEWINQQFNVFKATEVLRNELTSGKINIQTYVKKIYEHPASFAMHMAHENLKDFCRKNNISYKLDIEPLFEQTSKLGANVLPKAKK